MYNSLGTKAYRTGRSLGIKSFNIGRTLGSKMNPIGYIGNSVANKAVEIGAHAILDTFTPTGLKNTKNDINKKNNLLK